MGRQTDGRILESVTDMGDFYRYRAGDIRRNFDLRRSRNHRVST